MLSVVVPTRNRAHLLPRLLEALDSQTHPNFEVIVVDDSSEDETQQILAGWEGPHKIALRTDHPSGSYLARNLGWQRARGEIVAFTDDDCLPDPNWLAQLAVKFDDEAVIAAQGDTRVGPGEVTPFTHQIEQRRAGPPYRTCNIAYRRRTLEQLGGFEPLRWYADNILGLRARQLGSIAFAPDAIVTHPPRAREWRDRSAWRARFEADATHRRVLRETGEERISPRGPLLPVVLWIFRPLLKQSMAHVRYAIQHPRRYGREVRPMIAEKRELLAAIREPAIVPSPPLDPLPPEPFVSVVIVTRDREDSLALTLEALERQTYRNREVIVVHHARAAVLTLAAARQLGVDASRGQIIAFTDDDCLPDPGWLETVVRALCANPSLMGVQGKTEGERGPIGSHAIRVASPDRLYRTCNIAYRRDAVDAVGGFDARFSGWFEDTALGWRVSQHGPIGYAPDALVVHRAMPRRFLDRFVWRRLLSDEKLLATEYRQFYRCIRGPGFLPTVIVRWLIGSPLKTLWLDLRAGVRHPGAFGILVRDLAKERTELVRTLLDRCF